MRKAPLFWTTLLSVVLLFPTPTLAAPKIYSFQAEIWADNWFALYVNGKKVGQDSVPFLTERSFNAEEIRFKATYPLTIGIIAKDYAENDSGLEYIGKPNQQVGDGGLIVQIREVESGRVVGGTNSSWKSFVTFSAPLNLDCTKSLNPLKECKLKRTKNPLAWQAPDFKDSSWNDAVEYTPEDVGVKDGYFRFQWEDGITPIWSSDLKIENTILFRSKIRMSKTSSLSPSSFKVGSPDFGDGGLLPVRNTCDGEGVSPPLTFSGVPTATKSLVVIMDTIPGPPRPGETESGNHFYLVLYNLPPTTKIIPAGSTGIGTLGQNFQGRKLGYTPPCSQGGGMKQYDISAYALSGSLDLTQEKATGTEILKAMDGKILVSSKLKAFYERR